MKSAVLTASEKKHIVLGLCPCYFYPHSPNFWEYAAMSEAIPKNLTKEGHSISGHKLRIWKSSFIGCSR